MVKYLIMDVDGTITDGKIYIGTSGELMKAFSVKDGYAISYILKSLKIIPIVITARESEILSIRCKEIGINNLYQGKMDKLSIMNKIIGSNNFGQCAYFGDDILDLGCMKQIKVAGGIVGCPNDAVKKVKAISDYICDNKCGEGALREFVEWLTSPQIDNEEIKKRVEYAIDYISNLNTQDITIGKYDVNDFFYYSVQVYRTKEKEECVLESHRKYIDIQWIIEGEEIIEVTDISLLQCEEEYSSEKDIILWKPIPKMTRMALREGSYIILYPNHAHMGCIKIEKESRVKKIVGKVNIN